MINIFLYVVQREDDPFFGIKKNLANKKIASCDIRFSAATYDVIRSTEYSVRKYVRPLYYRKVYLELSRLLTAAIQPVGDKQVFIYLADEGVWAEMVKHVRQGLGIQGMNIKIVNVQHGFFEVVRQATEKNLAKIVRQAVNHITRYCLGYPIFGYGFGGSRLDYYFVYSPDEKKFLQGLGLKNVYFVPKLIKAGLIDRYNNLNIEQQGTNKALIVMPHFTREPGYNLDLDTFCSFLLPLVVILREKFDFDVTLRPHPGMHRDSWNQQFQSSCLTDLVSIDRKPNIVDSLAVSNPIFSLNSTALFEGLILGKLPVKLESPFLMCTLPYYHETIDYNICLDTQIRRILEQMNRVRVSPGLHDELDDFVVGIDV